MFKPVLGILGGGQLGSLLAIAAKKLDIRTVIFSDSEISPGKYFSDDFIFIYDNVDHGYKMIGNAVPVKFAFLVGKQIRKDLLRFDNARKRHSKGTIIKLD